MFQQCDHRQLLTALSLTAVTAITAVTGLDLSRYLVKLATDLKLDISYIKICFYSIGALNIEFR